MIGNQFTTAKAVQNIKDILKKYIKDTESDPDDTWHKQAQAELTAFEQFIDDNGQNLSLSSLRTKVESMEATFNRWVTYLFGHSGFSELRKELRTTRESWPSSDDLYEDLKKLRTEYQSLDSTLKNLRQDYADLDARFKTLQQDYQTLEQRLTEQQTASKAEESPDFGDLQETLRQNQLKLSQALQENHALQQQLQATAKEKAAVDEQLSVKEAYIIEQTQKLEATQKTWQVIDNENLALRQEYQSLLHQLHGNKSSYTNEDEQNSRSPRCLQPG